MEQQSMEMGFALLMYGKFHHAFAQRHRSGFSKHLLCHKAFQWLWSYQCCVGGISPRFFLFLLFYVALLWTGT